MTRRLFTSESVTEGHPDKIADQISDGVLDALLAQDPRSRVAVETLITTGQVHVAGEVTTETYVDIPGVIREKILEIGYDASHKGFDGASCGVSVSIGAQSPDIAQGVDDAYETREGQGADELDRQGAGATGGAKRMPDERGLPVPSWRDEEDLLAGEQVAGQAVELGLAVDEGGHRDDFAVNEWVMHDVSITSNDVTVT